MFRRLLVFVVISVLAAAVCIRLGFWQLSRLAERRARNTLVSTRLREAPVTLAALPADSGARHYRRVVVAGRPDYAHEFVLVNRTRDGSPGVHIITPLRIAGRDTLLLLNRGWIYSPNGTDADLSHWREGDSIAVTGYVEEPSRRPGPARLTDRAANTTPAYRWLDPARVARDLGAPVTSYYVAAEPPPGEEKPPLDRPVRVPPPALDEGPHQSYAIQWFSFALVSLVGAGIFVRAELRRPSSPTV